MANPSAKDPDHEFFLKETRQPVLVYKRDNMSEFMEYLKKERIDGGIETILYSTGQKYYIDRLVEIIDPKREVF